MSDEPVSPADDQPLSVPARPELTDGRRVAVLLSHGFTGSPASMTPWGRHLAERGYAVEVPLLPGHGTTWQDLNTLRWPDWVAALESVYARLRAEHDVVVVGGLSMGGALALRLAVEHANGPGALDGVVLVNPAVRTKRLDVKALPVLKHLLPSLSAIAGDIKKQGVVEHGYDRTPLRAIDSLISSWPALVADLPRVTAPLLYFRSVVDHVVDDSSEPLILGGVSSADVTVRRLPESYHVATLDHDAPQIFAESAAFVARVAGLATAV